MLNKKTIKWIIFGGGIGAAIGVGVITGVSLYLQNKLRNDNSWNVNATKGQKFSYAKNNQKYGFDHIEFNNFILKNPTNLKKETFISDIGKQYLINRFIETGIFGPEIIGLKSINIGNLSVIGENDKGLYTPGSEEIFLNPMTIWTSIYNSKAISNFNENDYEEMKAEGLFQTFFHEYSHHVVTSYAQNTRYMTENQVTTLKSNGQRTINWNKKFYDQFVDTFEYNKDQLEASKNYTGFATIGENLNIANLNYFYDAKRIFSIANDPNSPFKWNEDVNPINQKEIENYGFFPGGLGKQYAPFFDATIYADQTKFDYLYSMDELTVRKLLLSAMTLGQGYNKLAQAYLQPNERNYQIYMPDILAEIAKSDSILETQNIFASQNQNQPLKSVRYMSDYVFANEPNESKPGSPWSNNTKSEEYVGSINELMGYADGSDISFITLKNSYYAQEKQLVYREGVNDQDGDSIAIGGYVDEGEIDASWVNSPDTALGYMEGNQFIKVGAIKVFAHQNGFKRFVFQQDKTISNGEKYFYVSDYLTPDNTNAIVGKQLLIGIPDATNTWKTYKLQSYRGQNNMQNGVANSYSIFYQDITNNVYRPNQNQQDIIITKDGGTFV